MKTNVSSSVRKTAIRSNSCIQMNRLFEYRRWSRLNVVALSIMIAAAFGQSSDQLPLPARTHTFGSYLIEPVMTPLLPVFVSTVKMIKTYANDDIRALKTGAVLECGSTTCSGAPSVCTVTGVYQRPRKGVVYKNIGTGPRSSPYFSVKWQSGQSRLLINMQSLAGVYEDLSRMLTESDTVYNPDQSGTTVGGAAEHRARPFGGSKRILQGVESSGVFLVDSDENDKVTAEDSCLSEYEQNKLRRQANKEARKYARLERQRERALARYDRWVRKQLGVRKNEQNLTMTIEDYETYYFNPTNKKYPWKWEESEYFSVTPEHPVRQGAVPTVTQAAGKSVDSREDEVGVLNYVSSSFIFDYAIIIRLANGTSIRLDVTIVPKVYRKYDRDGRGPKVSAFLCRPDGVSNLTQFVEDYIPRSANCSAYTSRPAPYAISSPDFTSLHPEEAAWLEQRLDKTAPKVQQFVSDNLPNRNLNASEARLKVAIANTGGGKRAMLHSLGVAKALYTQGILDHASWTSGISGGSWYVTAHTLASLERTDNVADPSAVMQDIKERVWYSIYGDYFQGNEILTDVAFKRPLYPSRIPNSGITDGIFCQSELKLQSALSFSGRSASPLDYWARAITSQVVPQSMLPKRGLNITLSSLAGSSFLASHAGPLPIFQLQENKGDGRDNRDFRLWDVSPFDMTVMDGNLVASFPTSLLGSDATMTETCTVNLDNIGYLQGISSWAFGGFPPKLASMLCGKDIRQTTMCQATGLKNPFQGFKDIQSMADDLYSKTDIFVTDGGTQVNAPIWSFLSSARQADIIFLSDAGGETTTQPTLSVDTVTPNTCPVDAPSSSRCTTAGTWPGTSCCKECTGLATEVFGCFSSNDVTKSNLGKSIRLYKDRMPNNTAPPLPTTPSEDKKIGQRIIFFGCDTVRTKTPIVQTPNRVVTSGQSGHDTLKGCVNLQLPLGKVFRGEQQYQPGNVEAIFENGAGAGMPNDPSLPDFKKCLACLYYARAKALDNFMPEECTDCYNAYCNKP